MLVCRLLSEWFWFFVITLLSLPVLASTAVQEMVQEAYLIQNSGWMEPFYTDVNSRFKPLIEALISVTAEGTTPISILAFNQSVPGNASPRLLYKGTAGGNYAGAVEALQLARKPNDQGYADTDFNEAIKTTVVDTFAGKPGIIWIFSNNRNSPNNSRNTVTKNQDFYNLIHREPAISRVLAFPIGMSVTGKYYQASGLMIYALAYGRVASEHLTWLQRSGHIAKVLTQVPARLKPLDTEPVRLQPMSVKGNSPIQIAASSDQKALVLNIDAGNTLPVAEISTHIINDFSPYTIKQAQLSARFSGEGWNQSLPVSLTTLSDLKPGEAVEVTIKLPVPWAEIPSVWSWRAITNAGKQWTLFTEVSIFLAQQQLVLDSGFIDRLEHLFPGDPLPDIFLPPEEVKSSVAHIPVYLKINYSLYPLLLIVVVVLGSVVLVGYIAMQGCSARDYTIMVEGELRRISLSPFATQNIHKDDQRIAVIRRFWWTPKVVFVEQGCYVKVMR